MSGEKIPSWESELWSHVSRGNGVHCPLHRRCEIRRSAGWCSDDNRKQIVRLLDDSRFDPIAYDYLAKDGHPCRIFQLVEMLADELIKRGGVRYPPVPTRLVQLADPWHTTEVHMLPLRTCHGAIWHAKGGWRIQLRADDSSVMKRFTLFHEAFHILAHCRTTSVFGKTRRQGSFNELLADYFAGCTLMPREWVKDKWSEYKDLDRMTDIFDVPRSLMWIRLREIGLT